MGPDTFDGAEERRSPKKRINAIRRLEAFYCSPVDENGDFMDAEFGLGDIPAVLIGQATDILIFLESIDWKWDINTLLEQPAELFKAIMKLMVAGKKLKQQSEKKKENE